MYRLLPLLLLLTACGQDIQQVAPRDTLRSVVGTEIQEENAGKTLEKFRDFLDLDASRIDVEFTEDAEFMRERCQFFAGCTETEPNGYLITSYWPANKGTPQEYGYILAHEMCHVYYFQTSEQGDPNHTHSECFARPDAPKLYGDFEGIAWKASQELDK